MSRTAQRRFWAVLLLVSAAALLAGGWAYRQHHRYKHVAIHDPGMMYRSAWLEPDVFSELIETHQIRTVVNLCRPNELKQRRALQRRAVADAGARLIEISMPDDVHADNAAIRSCIELLGESRNYPMLVHCQHGVTRTAKFCAVYDVAFRGMSAEVSLESQPLFGREAHNVNVVAFAHNFEAEHERLYPTASAQRLETLRR